MTDRPESIPSHGNYPAGVSENDLRRADEIEAQETEELEKELRWADRERDRKDDR